MTWAFKTERYGLPHGKGWLNEPAGLLARMSAAYNAYSTWKEYKHSRRAADWANANPEKWELITWIIAEQRKADG